MKSFIIATIFMVLICYSNAQCNIKCQHFGTVDLKTCTCKCDPAFTGTNCEIPNFTCKNLFTKDLPECDFIPCTSDEAEYFCPKKCYCERPSILTEFCYPCFNDGVLDTKTCKCSCKNNFVGPRCQFAQDPCQEEDLPVCASVNCWNATEAMFFKCQKKCLCCGNKQCNNGLLTTNTASTSVNKCQCSCIGPYKPESDCIELIGNCVDEAPNCASQFGEPACAFPEIKALCPKFCKAC